MGYVLLKVDNISLGVDSKSILDNLSFSIRKNSINAILCPNNCGKTTLIKTLSGITCLDDGEIKLNDIELNKDNFNKYILEVGTVLEDIDNQFICDKVNEELKYPLTNLGCSFDEIQKRIDIVSSVLKLSLILGKDISRLSYFEKIKVLIAASIVHSPKLLLLDDIFRFLNKKEKKDLFKLLKDVNTKLSVAILYTTSSLEDVLDIDNILVINNGQVMMNGSFDNIIYNDNELSKIGIEIPLMIDLSRKLQFYKLIDKIYYDPDKVVDKLWK